MKKIWIGVVLVVVTVAVGSMAVLWGAESQETPVNPTAQAPAPKKKLPKVQVLETETKTIELYVDSTGEVIATNEVTIQSTVEGPIAYCPWREGDTVKKGEKLILIDRPIYHHEVETAKAALALAEAKLADLKAGARPEEIAQAREKVRQLEDCTSFAESDLKRTRELVDSGSLPGEMAEKARVEFIKCHTQLGSAREQLAMLEAGPTVTEIAVAEAVVRESASRVGLAQAKLDECYLTAPFDGVITDVPVRPGELVSPRNDLLKLIDLSSLVIRFAVPESNLSDIKVGGKVTVVLDAYPQQTFEGVIERVYPELVRNTRTRLIEAKLKSEISLLPGQFARVCAVAQEIPNAVMVPNKAVITSPRGDSMVFVVNEVGEVDQRLVSLGAEQGDQVQIVDGLSAGEKVIVGGNEQIKDGAKVQLVSAKQIQSAHSELTGLEK